MISEVLKINSTLISLNLCRERKKENDNKDNNETRETKEDKINEVNR